jgi:hypothetical protein
MVPVNSLSDKSININDGNNPNDDGI